MQVRLNLASSRDLVSLAAGSILTLLVFIVPLTGGLTRIPGDLGDPRFNSVILEHVFRWAIGRELSLWSPGFFFPFRDVLAFSDNHFGSVLTYGFARLAGVDREHAYLVWFAFGVLLNFVSTFYVMRRFGFGAIASICAALLYSAGLPTIFKTAHAQLTYRFAVPLAFWFLNSWLDDADPRKLLAAILFSAWQFLCSIYLGVFLFYTLTFLVIVRLLPWSGPRAHIAELVRSLWGFDWRKHVWLLLLVLSCCALLGGMLYKYAVVGAIYGLGRFAADIYPMLPVPGSYLINDQSWLYASLGAGVTVEMRHEHQMFIGFVAGILLFAGAVVAFRREVSYVERVALLVLAGLVLFTMNFGGATLYKLVLYLPGFSSVRAVARIVLVMMLPAAILVACAVQQGNDWLIGHGHRRLAAGFGPGCLVLLALEVLAVDHFSAPISEWREREAAVLQRIVGKVNRDELLLVPWGRFGRKSLSEIDGMVVAQDLGVATLNGYSGNFPSQKWVDAAWGNDCTNARKRLESFVAFMPIPNAADWLGQTEHRVRTVALDICSPGQYLEDLDPQLIRGLRLQPSLDNNGHARVTITNGSLLKFSSVTRLGPVRLSWRFTRPDQTDSQSGWDPRLDLEVFINPGESKSVEFGVALPVSSGDYQFEVSLVQEGVRWLHANGMPVGVYKFRIP